MVPSNKKIIRVKGIEGFFNNIQTFYIIKSSEIIILIQKNYNIRRIGQYIFYLFYL